MLNIKFQCRWFWRSRVLKILPYLDMAAMLVNWPEPFEQIFVLSFPQPLEALHESWLQLAQWLLRRCWLKVKEWPLPLPPNNLHALIKTIVAINFRPKSSWLSMKSYVLAVLPYLTFSSKKVRVYPMSSFENLGSTWIPSATYYFSWPSIYWI